MKVSVLGVGLCVLGLGCQPAAQAWVPGKTGATVETSDLTARWERAREQARPLEVEATVTRLGSDEQLASLRGRVDTRGVMVFETSDRAQPERARLSVQVEPRKEGGYALGVSWDEHSAEGRVVSWSPTLVLERGAASTAEIVWAEGEGRRLSLRIVDDAASAEHEAVTSAPVEAVAAPAGVEVSQSPAPPVPSVEKGSSTSP